MKNNIFLLTLILCFSLNSSNALATDTIALVMKSQNMPEYPVGHKIPLNSVIKTTDNQRLALKTNVGDTVIIGESAKLKLVKPNFIKHVFGKIYYFIRSRDTESELKVRTTVATIGIRGTRFIVSSNENDDGEIALAEGILNIESNDDQPFAIISKKELSEFERSKKETLDKYKDYKQNLQQEFIEYKKSFMLTENTSLSFKGKKVAKRPLDVLQKKDMQSFESFIEQNGE